MELRLMIGSLKNNSDETDMISEVSEMINKIFPGSDKDNIRYEENVIHYIPYKISDGKGGIADLKIECQSSDEESARVMSSIKRKIAYGKHRDNFSVICNRDEAGIFYSNSLIKPLETFEMRLRDLVQIIAVKSFENNEIVTSFPKELIDKIKEELKGNETNLLEPVFENSYHSETFDDFYFEEIFGASAEKSETVSEDEKNRTAELLNDLFIGNTNIVFLIESMNKLRKYRKTVMYFRAMEEEEFNKTQESLANADKQLKTAINELGDKTNAVLPALHDFVNNSAESLNAIYESEFINTVKAISENAEKLQKI